MKALFFAAFALYGIAVILEFTGTAFKKDRFLKSAWIVFLAAFAVHLAFIVARGIAAKRLPLSNQFEFANAFAWGVALLLVVMRPRLKTRSAWFGVHIGSAVISYASFVIAGCIALRYLLIIKRGNADDRTLAQMDYISYRMVAFGFLFLTVVILSGAIWAEQAWSAFWTWDPKEVWALITWIIYAVYLHLRLRMKRKGTAMAWFLVIAVPVVFFTFAGVNTLMHGLHTYG